MSLSIHTMPPEQRRAELQAVRAAAHARRIYELDATGPGFHKVTPVPAAIASSSRIRPVTCAMFRRIFGRAPSFTWAAEGRQAEAWDDRGNRLHVTQINDRARGRAG